MPGVSYQGAFCRESLQRVSGDEPGSFHVVLREEREEAPHADCAGEHSWGELECERVEGERKGYIYLCHLRSLRLRNFLASRLRRRYLLHIRQAFAFWPLLGFEGRLMMM